MSHDDPTSITLKVEPLALHNIGGEELSKQFQAELDKVRAAFLEDGLPYEGDKVKAKITVTIDLSLDTKTGAASLRAGVRSTLPKRKSLSRPVMLRVGGFLLEQDDEQLILYTSDNVTGFQE